MTREQEHAVKQQARQAANHDDDLGRARTKERAEWWVGELSYRLGIVDSRGMIDVNGEVARAFIRAYLRRPREVWPTPDTSGVHETRHLGFNTNEPRVVADFNTLPDLINHAARDLGATHVSGTGPETKIYFSRGGEYPYEEASVRRKGGYWHADGPGAREGVKRLPAGAKPIAGHARRAAEPRFKLGAPRPGTSVRDYEAVDNRGRRIAGPSKSYSDMKRAAGTAGVVKFVRPGASEAKRGNSDEARGREYAQEQIQSENFNGWIWDQMIEAEEIRKRDPSQVLPLNTDADFKRVAKNMLQQLKWDIGRSRELNNESDEFLEGLRDELESEHMVDWLVDELKSIDEQMKGPRHEQLPLPHVRARKSRRPKAKRSAKRHSPASSKRRKRATR